MSDAKLQRAREGAVTAPSSPTRPQPLSPKLQARRGVSREEVRAHQRERLHAAMVEAVAESGYAGTTTRRLRALAGVSERTLYEHFESKDAYFFSTYDQVVREGIERISAAYRARRPLERDWKAGLCRAFDAFVAEIVEHPKASRLALVEVLAVGPSALERIEVGEALFEEMIAQSLARAPEPLALPPVLLKGIVGGIWCVARQRLLEGSPEAIASGGRELLDWLLCYRSPAVVSLDSVVVELAPPSDVAGQPQRPPADERRRAMEAAAEIVASHGYEALSVARIAEEAELSPEEFFELFDSAEECFLASLELMSAVALARALRESEGAPSWPAAVCRAVRALLCQIAEDPVFARAVFVETFAAGLAGVERRAALVSSFATLLARRAPRARRPNSLVAEAIIGAGCGIARHHVTHGQAHALPALSGHAAYLVLAPIIGAEAAAEAIRAELGSGEEAIEAPPLAGPVPSQRRQSRDAVGDGQRSRGRSSLSQTFV